MRRFYVNVARSYVGRNVNLHLKDRSVIINVLLTDVKGNKRNPKLHYCTPEGGAEISIKNVDWVQPLNPLFNTWRDEKA
ncbi:MAG: hypothetical protein ACE5IF_06205 [Candidatus Bathyarchaeia archaeon]